MSAPAIRRLKVGPILVVIFVAAGLFAFDFALKDTEQAETRSEAQRLDVQASRLLGAGDSRGAVERFRQAHRLDRTNREYTLGLIEALTASGAFAEAQALIDDLLAGDPNNGQANLLAARLGAKSGKFPDAEAYYHRAIFGAWPRDSSARRVGAGLELAHALAARGAQSELLAELLPLESAAQNQPAVLKQIAGLYLTAGSPKRAADTYRQLIPRNPKDAELREGLGQAELADGDYRAAQAAFLSAFKLIPGNPDIRRDLELSSSLYALDPTPRKLPSADKYRRSLRILDLARDQAAACLAQSPADSAERGALAGLLEDTSGESPAQPVTNELAEDRLTQAERLWQAQRNVCPAGNTPQASELRLIMRKLAP